MCVHVYVYACVCVCMRVYVYLCICLVYVCVCVLCVWVGVGGCASACVCQDVRNIYRVHRVRLRVSFHADSAVRWLILHCLPVLVVNGVAFQHARDEWQLGGTALHRKSLLIQKIDVDDSALLLAQVVDAVGVICCRILAELDA